MTALENPDNRWSIGTFGAIGEFVRDASESTKRRDGGGSVAVTTARGGIRLSPRNDLHVVAYDTLVSDGNTWGNAVAFCLPLPTAISDRNVRRLGIDADALRAADCTAVLYDLGVGTGHVSMCLRTSDTGLIAALDDIRGENLLGPDGKAASRLIPQASPNRVMLSPLGRIEVFAPIPRPDGKSPSGPHTHMLPKLIASGRTHSANTPIPDNLQPILTMHPRSPWRDAEGKVLPYNRDLDESFDRILAEYGLEEDRTIRTSVEIAVRNGLPPDQFPQPKTRRWHTQLRITLRRLVQELGAETVARWKVRYDPVSKEGDYPAPPPHN